MRSCIAVLVIVISTIGSARAQDVSFYGFIKAESIHDTRQVAQVREGQFHLYPLKSQDLNADGHDDLKTSNFLFAAFQSRVGATAMSTDIVGGDVTGVVEADFFGSSNADVSMLRLRHAYARWLRGHNELLFGQYWSPLFTAKVYPGVVGFSTGAPFQPFARFPQLRYVRTQRGLSVLAAVSSQRDAFQEIGGRKMQHQSGLPAGHLHITLSRGAMYFGLGGTAKKILCYLDGPSFTARAVTVYSRWKNDRVSLTAKGVYGEDLADHLMTGGFVATLEGSVEPTRVSSLWLDMAGSKGELTAGLFGGYLRNLGTASTLDSAVEESFSRAGDLSSLWRISPRLTYQAQSVRLALEVEVTSARYSRGFNDHYAPRQNSKQDRITNVRTLIAAYYLF